MKRINRFLLGLNIGADILLLIVTVFVSTPFNSLYTSSFLATVTLGIWAFVTLLHNIYMGASLGSKIILFRKHIQFLFTFSLLYFALKEYKKNWFVGYDFDTLISNLFLYFLIWKTLFFFLYRYFKVHKYRNKIAVLGKNNYSLELRKILYHNPKLSLDLTKIISLEDHNNFDHIILKLNESQILGQVDWLYINYSLFSKNMLSKIIYYCETRQQNVRVMSDMKSVFERNITMEYHDYLPVMSINYTPLHSDDWHRFYKRLFDIAFSLVLIILTSPILLISVFITKISSKGPILFRQERVGEKMASFQIYKLRSMAVRQSSETFSQDRNDAMYITKWGKFIRKFKIDELPQLFNILKGEMSVVGPRALPKYEVEQMIEEFSVFRRLFTVKPGLTSLGQIRYGRANTKYQTLQRMRIDLLYHQNISLWLDLKIIYLTAFVVLKGKT